MARTALITGGSGGIGAAVALKLAADGCNVAIGCRNTAAGETVAESCRELGAKAHVFPLDVASSGECAAFVAGAIEQLGSADILVNNAGITKDGLLARMSEEAFDEVIATNLKGAFAMMRHATPHMMKQRWGRIINITSVVGMFGNAGQANYCASKAGIAGMTKSAAKELGSRGITVNAVAPGFIETKMTASLSEKQTEAMFAMIAAKRAGKPEEVAALVSFLASDAAAYITGQEIRIDGGMSI